MRDMTRGELSHFPSRAKRTAAIRHAPRKMVHSLRFQSHKSLAAKASYTLPVENE